ncbi:MAG: 30S ribosomal protein S17 [Candidatus Peribacteria bacterium]|nr:30S ribosomal protein S17 [Candidatus Peribacteria bacterium]
MGEKNIKELIGEIVSDKMNKTCVVLVKSVKMHPIYKKRFVVREKYYVHNEDNQVKIGDRVKIRAIKPLSKLKKWEIVEVL